MKLCSSQALETIPCVLLWFQQLYWKHNRTILLTGKLNSLMFLGHSESHTQTVVCKCPCMKAMTITLVVWLYR